MTAPVFGSAPANAVDFMLSWLRPLNIAANAVRRQKDPLPFVMVTRIGGADDGFAMMVDQPIVSVHIFDDDYTDCSNISDRVHSRMLLLINNPCWPVTLNDGTVAVANSVTCVEKPTHRNFEEPDVYRFVGRYHIELPFFDFQP